MNFILLRMTKQVLGSQFVAEYWHAGFSYAWLQVPTLLPTLISIFFPWEVAPTCFIFLCEIADISANESFSFIFFGTGSVGNSKATTDLKSFLRPSGVSSTLIEESSARMSEYSQSTLSRIHLILFLVLGNWCWTRSAQHWSMIYGARCCFRKAFRDNPVFPVHFWSANKSIVCFIFWSQRADPTNWAIRARYTPFHSCHAWMAQSLWHIAYSDLPWQCFDTLLYLPLHRYCGNVAGGAPSPIWLIHALSNEAVQWPA